MAPAKSMRPPPAIPGVYREQLQRKREDGHPDGQVDEEDPVPVEEVREDAACEHANGSTSGEDEAEDPHRLRPVGRLGEEHHRQRERDRSDERAAEALHRARGDQLALRGRETAGERRDREEPDSDQEHATLPEQVAQPSAEQQEAAEREQVGVDHPGERSLREAEIVPNSRERDVHDRAVEHDHQVAEAEDVERKPATAAGCRHTRPLRSLVFPWFLVIVSPRLGVIARDRMGGVSSSVVVSRAIPCLHAIDSGHGCRSTGLDAREDTVLRPT